MQVGPRVRVAPKGSANKKEKEGEGWEERNRAEACGCIVRVNRPISTTRPAEDPPPGANTVRSLWQENNKQGGWDRDGRKLSQNDKNVTTG